MFIEVHIAMKTIPILAVMVSIFTAARCYPSGPTNETEFKPSDSGSSHFQVFGNATSNSTKENTTESEGTGLTIFGFHLPPVFQIFLNETSNSTKGAHNARFDDTDRIEVVEYSFDSKDEDDDEDETPAVVEVDEYGALVYDPAVASEENASDASVAGNFGEKIANRTHSSNETVTNSHNFRSSVHPVVLSETVIFETDILGNENETSANETGRDVGDVFYRSGIPAFPYQSGLSETSDANLRGHQQTKNENSKDITQRDTSFPVGNHYSKTPSSSNDGNFADFGSASNLHSGYVAPSFGGNLGGVHSESSSFAGAPNGYVNVPESSDYDYGASSSSGFSSPAGVAPSGVSSHDFNSGHLGSPATLGVGSSDGSSSGTFASDVQSPNNGKTSFSASSGTNSGSAGYSSVASNIHGSPLQRRSGLDLASNVTESERKEPVQSKPVVEFASVTDGSKSSVHRRAARQLLYSDTSKLENTTDISVKASVSSSADNFHTKIYDSVNPNISGISFSASSNAKNDSAPQHFGSDNGFGSSSSVAAGQPSIHSSPESKEAESTTQAAYDEEAAIIQRQRLAELRRKFLEGDSKDEASESDEDIDTGKDFQ